MASSQPLRILELYSGIGGMHMAAKESGLPFKIVESYEINTTALDVYRHNFPNPDTSSNDNNNSKKEKKKKKKEQPPRNIMGMTVDQLAKLQPDLIMMSPPCQPFTRQGLKRDVEDARTSSLLHVLDLLGTVPQPPHMILLENVAGFESSQARERLLQVLAERDYIWQEFLLTPTQFGIPNSRLRYYLLAKQKPGSFTFTPTDKVEKEFPVCCCIREMEETNMSTSCQSCSKPFLLSIQHLMYQTHSTLRPNHSIHDLNSTYEDQPFFTKEHTSTQGCTSTHDTSTHDQNSSHSTCLDTPTQSLHFNTTTHTLSPYSLSNYLDSTSSMESYLLSDKILIKYHMILDIVSIESRRSCCFTKGYAHYVEGTGSVIQHNSKASMSEIYAEVEKIGFDETKKIDLLHNTEVSEGNSEGGKVVVGNDEAKKPDLLHQTETTKVEEIVVEGDETKKSDLLYQSEATEVRNTLVEDDETKKQKKLELLQRLQLRYFTPEEMAKLMCFPAYFSFPENTTRKQKYRVLGNSINVLVVTALLLTLVQDK